MLYGTEHALNMLVHAVVQIVFKFMFKSCSGWTWSEHEFMFRNMKSCSRTCTHVPEHALYVQIMFSLNMNFTWSEHEIMFQNMISCSGTWLHVPLTCSMFRNMISCTWTWNHVLEHDFMFQSCFNKLNMLQTWSEHKIMYWYIKSCSGTWFHVQEHALCIGT